MKKMYDEITKEDLESDFKEKWKGRKYLKGSVEVSVFIGDYVQIALYNMPEEFQEKASPTDISFKRGFASRKIVSEPREKEGETYRLHVDSAQALINPSWKFCGVDEFAEHKGESKRKVEYNIPTSDALSDSWNGHRFFCTSSLDPGKTR